MRKDEWVGAATSRSVKLRLGKAASLDKSVFVANKPHISEFLEKLKRKYGSPTSISLPDFFCELSWRFRMNKDDGYRFIQQLEKMGLIKHYRYHGVKVLRR